MCGPVSQSNTIEGYLNIETVNKETKAWSEYNRGGEKHHSINY